MAFPDGIWANKPPANAPKFVLANVNIDKDRLMGWLNDNVDEKGRARLTLKISRAGKYYLEVNDWKPSGDGGGVPVARPEDFEPQDDDLPF